MNIHTLVMLAVCLLASALPKAMSAQTCRVNAGTCAGGTTAYKEVFEYDFVEVKPEFPGGGCCMLKYINENRNYPKEAYSLGIEGRVTCSFVVNCDGTISNISVIKGVESSLNEEAVRVISSMPCWSPGKMGGRNVPVRVVYAVPFRR